jgi:hypothetical protein
MGNNVDLNINTKGGPVHMSLYLRIIYILATLAVLIGIVGWSITLNVDPIKSTLATAWQITWIVNPLGFILSIYLLNMKVKFALWLVLLNFIMIVSFVPMWFVEDFINSTIK